MAEALFINAEYIKSVSVIDENVDDKMMAIAIKRAQDLRIHPVLGTTLFEALKTKVLAGTVTGNYKTLMDSYIVPCLTEWVIYEATILMVYKYRNKMIGSQTSDNASPIDNATIDKLKDEQKNVAEWRQKRLVAYLCENEDLFDEYDDNPDGDDIQSQKDVFTSPIYLPGYTDCCDPKNNIIDL